jgi:hypothetical protein
MPDGDARSSMVVLAMMTIESDDGGDDDDDVVVVKNCAISQITIRKLHCFFMDFAQRVLQQQHGKTSSRNPFLCPSTIQLMLN